MIGPEELFKWLVESLRLVGSDYDIQVSALPAFVHVPDEVAITYGECVELADQIQKGGLLDEETLQSLYHLRNHLKTIGMDKRLWSLESLRDRPEWQKARLLARELLDRLGKPLTRPNLYWTRYVESRKAEGDPLAGIDFDES